MKEIIKQVNQAIGSENRKYEEKHNSKIQLSELKNFIKTTTITKFKETFNSLKNMIVRNKDKTNERDINRD